MAKIFIIVLGLAFVGSVAIEVLFINKVVDDSEKQTVFDIHRQSNDQVTDEPVKESENIDSKQTSHNLELDLTGQNLTKVPSSVFNKTNIEVLNLSHNQLSGALPAEVRRLQGLRVLDLSNNQFTGVPAEIGQLTKLEVLNLSNNQITGLPLEISNLINLRVLDLRGNNYSTYDLDIIKNNLPKSVTILVD